MLVADTTFLIRYAGELQDRRRGPATREFEKGRREKIVISMVCVAEFLRNRDPLPATEFLSKFEAKPINWRTAELWALVQMRASSPLSDNDAWVAATAWQLGAGVIGRDDAFKRVPRLRYIELPPVER